MTADRRVNRVTRRQRSSEDGDTGLGDSRELINTELQIFRDLKLKYTQIEAGKMQWSDMDR